MSATDRMTLRLRLPTRILYEGAVIELGTRAEDGAFAILPRHVDFVTALVPAVLVAKTADGEEKFFGIDEGVLVKHGFDVDVCVRRAVAGRDLVALRETVRDTFVEVDEHEKVARSALARLEADMVRRFAELKDIA